MQGISEAYKVSTGAVVITVTVPLYVSVTAGGVRVVVSILVVTLISVVVAVVTVTSVVVAVAVDVR